MQAIYPFCVGRHQMNYRSVARELGTAALQHGNGRRTTGSSLYTCLFCRLWGNWCRCDSGMDKTLKALLPSRSGKRSYWLWCGRGVVASGGERCCLIILLASFFFFSIYFIGAFLLQFSFFLFFGSIFLDFWSIQWFQCFISQDIWGIIVWAFGLANCVKYFEKTELDCKNMF